MYSKDDLIKKFKDSRKRYDMLGDHINLYFAIDCDNDLICIVDEEDFIKDNNIHTMLDLARRIVEQNNTKIDRDIELFSIMDSFILGKTLDWSFISLLSIEYTKGYKRKLLKIIKENYPVDGPYNKVYNSTDEDIQKFVDAFYEYYLLENI